MGEVSEDWNKANVTATLRKGKTGNPVKHRPVCLTPAPGKVLEQSVLQNISKHPKDKKVVGNSQHVFIWKK